MSDLPHGALATFGWSDRVLALFNDLADSRLEPARVVRVERSSCAAVFADGAERLLHAPLLPSVGDWVAVHGETVRHVLPRWSALAFPARSRLRSALTISAGRRRPLGMTASRTWPSASPATTATTWP